MKINLFIGLLFFIFSSSNVWAGYNKISVEGKIKTIGAKYIGIDILGTRIKISKKKFLKKFKGHAQVDHEISIVYDRKKIAALAKKRKKRRKK